MLRASCQFFAFVALFVGTNNLSTSANDGKTKPGDAKAEKLAPRAVTRLGSTAFAQTNVIYAVALAPGGKMAATADSGEIVRDDDGNEKWNYDRLAIHLWDVPAGQSSKSIPVGAGPVLALDFSPDGNSLAAAVGKKILIWNVKTAKEFGRVAFNQDITLTRYTPDGKHLLVNLFDKQTLQWEVVQYDLEKRSKKALWSSKKIGRDVYVPSLDVSPDGARIGFLIAKVPEFEEGKPLVAPNPHQIKVVDLASGQSLFQADGKGLGNCLALSPDQKSVVFGDERLALWDIARDKKIRDFAAVPSRPRPPIVDLPADAPPIAWKESRSAELVAFSPDGKFVVSACWPNFVTLWNAESGAKIGDYLHSFRRPLFHAGDVLVFSRDSKTLALGGSQVLRLIDTSTGKEISSWPGHRLPISSFRFSPDGQTLFSYTEAEVCAWQAGTWKQQYRHDLMPLQKKSVLGISYETNWMVTWSKGEYLLEDLPSGKVLAKFPTGKGKFDGAQFSFEGKTCCLDYQSDDGDFSAVFYSLPDCKELFQLKLSKVRSAYFSPVRNAFSWTDQMGFRFEADGITGKTNKSLGVQTFEPGGAPVISLGSVFSWDGRYLLTQTADAQGQAVRIWDLKAGRTTHRLKFPFNRFIDGIDFSFDNRLMVFTQVGRNGVCVLELASGKERRSLIAAGQPNPRRVVTSPTDFVIAAGLPGNTLMVWDLARPAGKAAPTKLTDKEIGLLWLSLAADNAIEAEGAVESLVQHPEQAVPFLRTRLKAVAPLDANRLDRLIADLGSETTEVQETAVTELEKNLELAEPALRQAISKGKASAESKKNMKDILAKPLAEPDAETLRTLRALEVLEKIGTQEVRPVIEPLTRGAPGARVTQDASATLKRLDRYK
jgi:WD40 repeat protein